MTVTRAIWLVFIVSVVVRVAYTLGIYFGMGPAGLMEEDSPLYMSLARDFLATGDFVRVTAAGTYLPETERMPLYILYLAAHQGILGSTDPLFPALTQAGLGAVACVIIARLAGMFDARLALPAGLFAACSPTLVIVGATILTEGLFFVLSAAALWVGLLWIRAPSWRDAAILGAMLGLAVATRTMALPWAAAYLALLPLGSALLAKFRPGQLAQMGLVAVIVIAVQAPVIARNVSEFGSWQLTSQGGAHTLNWVVPLVMEARDGTPHVEGARQMQTRYEARFGTGETANPFEKSNMMTSLAGEVLGEMGVGPIVKAWALGAGINLMSPAPVLAAPVKSLPRTGFFDTPGDSKLAKIGAFLFRNDSPVYAWVLLVSIVGVMVVRILQLGGLVFAVGQGASPPRGSVRGGTHANARTRRVMLAFLLLWVAYILLINGPVASPKYRLPIEPVGAIMFAFAFARVWDWWTRRRARWR